MPFQPSFNDEPPPLEEGYWAALLREGEYAFHSAPLDFEESLVHHPPPAAKTDHPLTPNPLVVETAWEQAAKALNHDEVIELLVLRYNRGGLLVEWNQLPGFIPTSQLLDLQGLSSEQARRMLPQYVQRTLRLRIIELEPEKNRLVFSERAANVEQGKRAALLEHLQPDQICQGCVTNICDFGAFIDLGGIEGLIHISEMSWGRVNHPADLLQHHQTVNVYIVEVNRSEKRIALSLKRLIPDPWITVETRYHVGQTLTARITHIEDFGAFAALEPSLEGLIHVSQLAEGQFLHPRNIVAKGQEVTVRILNIDRPARRLGLSLLAEQSS